MPLMQRIIALVLKFLTLAQRDEDLSRPTRLIIEARGMRGYIYI